MTLPRPTVFISYASEDRAAVLLLRAALEAGGLDVWYDANELGGGDAWDQKIRRQIRECDYFMPVISATTERRKEGYFRREWRLAAERTLDMADDVMFLLPVTIDGTTDSGARVPEKFLVVQWLRVPGGTPTPALEALAKRLAAGDHSPLPPKLPTQPPFVRKERAEAAHDGPPPMPPFPHPAEKGGFGHGLKFIAEVIWWVITAGWLLLRRAPKWVRVVVSLWFCVTLISYCRSSSSPPRAERTSDTAKSAKAAQVQAEIKKAAESFKASGSTDWAKLGSEIAGRLATELKDSEANDKQIVAVPFASGISDPADAKFLADVFTPLWGRLSIERSGNTGLISTPLSSPANETLVGVGQKLDATYVLGARLVRPPEAGASNEAKLEVVLLKVESGSVAWSGSFGVKDADPTSLARAIGDGVLATTAK